MSEGTAHIYYAACEGRWRSPLDIVVHDPVALATSGMGLLDRMGLRLLAAWPHGIGRVMMQTTVARRGDEVVHTTTLRWRGVPLRRTVEIFVLDDDGRRFSVHGAMEGEGHVEDDALRASYSLRWLGVHLTQHTERDGDRVIVHQEGPVFRGTQRLERVEPPEGVGTRF